MKLRYVKQVSYVLRVLRKCFKRAEQLPRNEARIINNCGIIEIKDRSGEIRYLVNHIDFLTPPLIEGQPLIVVSSTKN